MKFAPVALFVYKRLEHLQKVVFSLQKNELSSNSDLIIFSDGSKNNEDASRVLAVREYLKSISGFKSIGIIERESNIGLANSIIQGVSEVLNSYDRVIVMEDDLVVSPFFLNFMNDSLTLYENEEKVGSIHGYVYPIKQLLPETFFIKGADCWGWGTWKRAWQHFESDGEKLLKGIKERKAEKEFDLDNSYPYLRMLKDQIKGKNDSWAIRWHASLFLKEILTLYPGKSFVQNIGLDDSGTHTKTTDSFDTLFVSGYEGIRKTPTIQSEIAREAFKDFFFSVHRNPLKRILKL